MPRSRRHDGCVCKPDEPGRLSMTMHKRFAIVVASALACAGQVAAPGQAPGVRVSAPSVAPAPAAAPAPAPTPAPGPPATPAASATAPKPSPQPRVLVGRSKVATRYGLVATSQPLAVRAGVQILERGGNAIDAAIATNAVMGVVEPNNSGLGGDMFAIYYEARTGKLYGLNASGWAPSGLTPQLMR